ncbi:MAG: hypothetical protein ACU836_12320 [Gammaproteobacteria bacterium]
MIVEEPIQFKELCEKVGIAFMMGQKVQFALAHYYSVFHMVNSGWSTEKAKEKIKFYLSKPMGVLVDSIEKDGQLDRSLIDQVIEFMEQRNWLAYNFDEESILFLSQNHKLDFYIGKMEKIVFQAENLMVDLDEIGEQLVPISFNLTLY